VNINLVVLKGRLATAPEFRDFESGSRLVRMLITVKSDEPRRRVDVVPVTLWDPPDDFTPGTLPAGKGVWVLASVQRRFWESDDGRKSRLEVVAHQVELSATDDLADAAT